MPAKRKLETPSPKKRDEDIKAEEPEEEEESGRDKDDEAKEPEEEEEEESDQDKDDDDEEPENSNDEEIAEFEKECEKRRKIMIRDGKEVSCRLLPGNTRKTIPMSLLIIARLKTSGEFIRNEIYTIPHHYLTEMQYKLLDSYDCMNYEKMKDRAKDDTELSLIVDKLESWNEECFLDVGDENNIVCSYNLVL